MVQTNYGTDLFVCTLTHSLIDHGSEVAGGVAEETCRRTFDALIGKLEGVLADEIHLDRLVLIDESKQVFTRDAFVRVVPKDLSLPGDAILS